MENSMQSLLRGRLSKKFRIPKKEGVIYTIIIYILVHPRLEEPSEHELQKLGHQM